MYELRNNRRRRTTIALPGRGIHLEPTGTTRVEADGTVVDVSKAIVSDEEFAEAEIQGKLRDKIILADKCEHPVGVKTPRDNEDLSRIQSMRKIQERRRVRAENTGEPQADANTDLAESAAERPRKRRKENSEQNIAQEERKE